MIYVQPDHIYFPTLPPLGFVGIVASTGRRTISVTEQEQQQ